MLRGAKVSRRYPRRWLTTGRRRLPDFAVIGAQKCASTSLYRFITDHPKAAAARTKELQYFTTNYRLGERWYRSSFPVDGDGRITGEASVNYMFHAEAPARMAAHLPDIRLLAILRDPVERAYSHHRMMLRRGWGTSTFEDALDAEESNWGGRIRWLFEDGLPPSFYNGSCLARGHYADQLANWFAHYPRDRFLILSTDDLRSDPGGAMAKVFEFLGLEPFRPAAYRSLNEGGSHRPMKGETRDRLIEHFRPHNARLNRLLGRDFGWES